MRKIGKIFVRENKKLLRLFSNHTFVYLTLMGNGLLLIATAMVWLLEKNQPNAQIHSFFDALWWGVSTITTIGYGDLLPQTFLGRIIGIVLMYTGTVLFVSFTGVLLSTLLKEEVEEGIAPLKKEIQQEEKDQDVLEQELKEIRHQLEKLEKK